MSSIGSIGSGSSWAAAQQRPSKEALFQSADADGSGGVDASELQQVLANRLGGTKSASGTSTDDGATLDFSKLDGDGNGSLDATELDEAMKSLMPKPSSTMEFAQQRGGAGGPGGEGGSDDLFAKVDGNSDGSIDSDELKALQEKMGLEDDEAFSRLDTDDSGTLSAEEFAAGRPDKARQGQGASSAQGGTQAAQGGGPRGPHGGPPPAADSEDSTSTAYDPLDTNQDGVVSAQEQAAGELKALMEQVLQAAAATATSR